MSPNLVTSEITWQQVPLTFEWTIIVLRGWLAASLTLTARCTQLSALPFTYPFWFSYVALVLLYLAFMHAQHPHTHLPLMHITQLIIWKYTRHIINIYFLCLCWFNKDKSFLKLWHDMSLFCCGQSSEVITNWGLSIRVSLLKKFVLCLREQLGVWCVCAADEVIWSRCMLAFGLCVLWPGQFWSLVLLWFSSVLALVFGRHTMCFSAGNVWFWTNIGLSCAFQKVGFYHSDMLLCRVSPPEWCFPFGLHPFVFDFVCLWCCA